MGNKVTENSAGEQPRLQLNNINKKNAIKTPKVVNIFITQYPKKLNAPTLGGCPRIENLLRKSHKTIFSAHNVTRTNYLNQMIKKSDSKSLYLATVPILGQPASE
jgi:hypothetical protein